MRAARLTSGLPCRAINRPLGRITEALCLQQTIVCKRRRGRGRSLRSFDRAPGASCGSVAEPEARVDTLTRAMRWELTLDARRTPGIGLPDSAPPRGAFRLRRR